MAKAWVFGDGISTDLLAPGNKLKLNPEELSRHCLTAIRPDFPTFIAPGDIIFAGKNFGQGSSREQAAVSLKLLGANAIFAQSFARIFYRNALNLGLPVFDFPNVNEISEGDEVILDLAGGRLSNPTTAKYYEIEPLPPELMEIVRAGGLINYLEEQFRRTK
jgi:3-isopropylmalate/(R)-2-methylmalate dehydratase small subunit